MNKRFPALEAYRATLIAHWQEASAALEKAWARFTPAERHKAASIVADLLEFETREVLPMLVALLGRQIPQPDESDLAAYRIIREREIALTADLNVAAWSAQTRHPRFGVRTTLWWVEKSLAVAKETLNRLRAISQQKEE